LVNDAEDIIELEIDAFLDDINYRGKDLDDEDLKGELESLYCRFFSSCKKPGLCAEREKEASNKFQ